MNTFSNIPEGFFGESGLTSTSANHIANLLKMQYQRLENDLRCLNFVEEKVTIIGSDKENVTRRAITASNDEIAEHIDKIARYKGFIAFLREAIKCKNELTNEIDLYESELPVDEMPKMPIMYPAVSTEWIIEQMPIGERVKYLSVEARAATYGKYIHPDELLDVQRKKVFAAFNQPTDIAMAGRDSVIIKRESAVQTSDIDALLMRLQSEHRKSEAELNGYKHDIEEKVKADQNSKLEEYKAQKAEYDRKMDEYNRKCADIKFADMQTREERRKVIEALKIVIPNTYKDLYEEVNG